MRKIALTKIPELTAEDHEAIQQVTQNLSQKMIDVINEKPRQDGPLPRDTWSTVLYMYRDKKFSTHAIGRYFNVLNTAIVSILKKMSVVLRPSGTIPLIPPEERDNVMMLSKELSVKQIAEHYKVKPIIIQRIIDKRKDDERMKQVKEDFRKTRELGYAEPEEIEWFGDN